MPYMQTAARASGMQHSEDFGSGSPEIGVHSCVIGEGNATLRLIFFICGMETIVPFIEMYQKVGDTVPTKN